MELAYDNPDFTGDEPDYSFGQVSAQGHTVGEYWNADHPHTQPLYPAASRRGQTVIKWERWCLACEP